MRKINFFFSFCIFIKKITHKLIERVMLVKKFILIITAIIILFFVYSNEKVDAEVVIPDGAIRVRVIANSNTIEDQNMKIEVKKYIENNLSILLLGVDNLEEARLIINNNIDDLDSGIKEIFDKNDYSMDYKINFGDNYFPDKEYKGVVYNDGVYESLVVTIGEGDGDNWWCVLFPPLCLLETNESEVNDVEYRSWVMEMVDRIF